MPHEIRIPRLDWSMEEGVFVGWLKQPGDAVAVGEALFELESDKALQPVESLDGGTLYIAPDAPQPGATVAVGTLLGYLLAAGEAIPVGRASSPPERASPVTAGNAASAARVQRASSLPGRPVKPIATPRAKRVAAELGVDWTSIDGTGAGGRIREADVRAASGHSASVGSSAPIGVRGEALLPRRKALADRLRWSRDRTVPVTLTTTADATELVAMREQYRAAGHEVIPAYTDIVAALVARTLQRHPRMAVRWEEGRDALISLAADELHVAIAVDTPDGSLAPVIRGAVHKSALEIARESKPLIDRARQGRLTAGAMQDGVITVTNLGGFGIDAFTPIINYPQIAILGLGAIRRVPVVLSDGRIAPRHQITLSLTFDHAAVDGAPAAAFLRDFTMDLESAKSLGH